MANTVPNGNDGPPAQSASRPRQAQSASRPASDNSPASADAQSATALERQQAEISARLRNLSQVLRDGGEALEDDESAARLLDVAGSQFERAADYVDDATPGSVVADVQRFARARPEWFLGGVFLGGLVLGRFLKSSAPNTRAPSALPTRPRRTRRSSGDGRS